MSNIKLIPDKRLIDLVEEFYKKLEISWDERIKDIRKQYNDIKKVNPVLCPRINDYYLEMNGHLEEIRNFQKMLLLAMYLNQEVTITPDDCQYFDIKI